MVHGTRQDTAAVREDLAAVLAPLVCGCHRPRPGWCTFARGSTSSGFHIRWRRKRGTNIWHVYTLIADRPLRSLKAKTRALTPRKSQQDLGSVLRRLNLIMRGWSNYFKHAVAQRVFDHLAQFTGRRLITMMMVRHRWSWTDVRRWLVTPSGSWRPIAADGIELFNIAGVPVTRYRWRSSRIPNP